MQSPPDPKQRAAAKTTYKRGYEARLSAAPDELEELLRLLRAAAFEPGSPFQKNTRMVVPLYGRAQVQRFREMVGA